MPDRWKWILTAYYGPAATPPARDGEVAAELTVLNDEERDRERAALEARADIARVETWRCS